MNWLFEHELVVVALGVAAILALGAAWSSSGRKELLYAVGAAFALLIAGLIVERVVVTDQEAIRATLQQIARDVKSNNRSAVTRHIHSAAPSLKQKAEAELPNYLFTECRITKINLIDVDSSADPRSALVELNLIASGTFKHEGFEVSDTIPRWVKLHLLRENDGRWTVAEYEHDSPQRMLMSRP
jgi:hypothetical protein